MHPCLTWDYPWRSFPIWKTIIMWMLQANVLIKDEQNNNKTETTLARTFNGHKLPLWPKIYKSHWYYNSDVWQGKQANISLWIDRAIIQNEWEKCGINSRANRRVFQWNIWQDNKVTHDRLQAVWLNSFTRFVSFHVFVGWTWRHQMETFSALLAICAGKSPVTGEFFVQSPVTRCFGVFFDLRLNKRFCKQWWGWCFETPSRPLWRHCNGNNYRFYPDSSGLRHWHLNNRPEATWNHENKAQ